MQQNVMRAQFLEQILGFRSQAQFAGHKRAILQIRSVYLFVNVEKTHQVHRAIHGKDLPGIELKHSAQAVDNFRVGVSLDLQAHRIALAAVVQFRAHRFQQAASLFLR